MGIGSKLKNAFFGKKASDVGFAAAPESAEQERARREGLNAQIAASRMINETPVEQQALAEQQAELRQTQGGLGDIRRRVQEMMAQRGIKNSSIGIGTQIAAERNIQDRMSEINASLPERIRRLREERAARLSSIGAQMTGSAGQRDYMLNERQGGMFAPLLSTGGNIAASYYGAKAGRAG